MEQKKFWVAKCENSIRKYAEDIDADYELLKWISMGEGSQTSTLNHGW